MSEPIKLPDLPETEYTLAVPAAPYEPAWISSMEAWDESAMETYARLAVEQATAELRAKNQELCEMLEGFMKEFGDKATNANVRKARAALKEVR